MLSLVGNTAKVNSEIEKVKSSSEIINIKSRFGEFQIDPSKAIYFPKGLYGFAPELHFALTSFIKPEMGAFKILQCINDHSVSLPVLPTGYDNGFIESTDMEEMLKSIEVSRDNLLLLFILTSVKKPDGSFEIYANIKAPIVVDSKLQMAIQHVFTSNKYSIRQKI